MEHINRIELAGRVGTIRLNEYGGQKVANFSVITELFFKRMDGSVISESTWHNVTAWEGPTVPDLTNLQKGAAVKISGRLRNSRYTSADGTEKTYIEVLASSLKILPREG